MEAAHLTEAQARAQLGHPRPRTTLTYDAAGHLRSADSSIGGRDGAPPQVRRSLYGYDGLGRQVRVTEGVLVGPGGTLAYGAARVSTSVFDVAGNVIETVDGRGVKTAFAHDALNRLVVTTQKQQYWDPLRTTLVYDALDRVVEQQTPLGTTKSAYDRLGRLRQVKDPARQGQPSKHVVEYFYDAAGRQLALIDSGLRARPGNETELYTDITRYTYDPLGRQSSVVSPSAFGEGERRATITYDALGRPAKVSDRDGRKRTFEYDGLGRQTHEHRYQAGGEARDESLVYVYDAAGHLTESYVLPWAEAAPGDPTPTLKNTRQYDALGRLTLHIGPFGLGLRYDYDAGSRQVLAEEALAAGTAEVPGLLRGNPKYGAEEVVSTYDAADRLVERQLKGGPEVTWRTVAATWKEAERGKRDLVEYVRAYEGLSQDADDQIVEFHHVPDELGRPLKSSVKKDAGTLLRLEYHYNSKGLLNLYHRTDYSKADYSHLTTWMYDELGQVTSEWFRPGDARTEPEPDKTEYDDAGNPIQADAVYLPGNRLQHQGDYTYTYDREGNTTTVQWKHLLSEFNLKADYDPANRLVGLDWQQTRFDVPEQKGRVEYVYDAEGHLVERRAFDADGSLTQDYRHVYDGEQVWADVDAVGSPSKVASRYLRGVGVDELWGRQLSRGGTVWYVTDYQGSVLGAVNDSGSLADPVLYRGPRAVRWEHRPFWDQHRYKYTGRPLDVIAEFNGQRFALQYNRGRWYNPQTGRWMSEDPIGFAGGDTNLYRYVGNSYPNATDPSGLASEPSGAQNWLTGGYVGRLTGWVVAETFRDYRLEQQRPRAQGESAPSLAAVAWRDGSYVAGEAGAGLKIGAKSTVNAGYHTVVSVGTVGLVDHGGVFEAGELWAVSPEERELYEQAYGYSRFGTEMLVAAATGNTSLLGKAGWVGKGARALTWLDTGRNLSMGVQGTAEIYRDGGRVTFSSGSKLLGFAGARGNLGALQQAGKAGRVGRAVSVAETWVATSRVGRGVGAAARVGGRAAGRAASGAGWVAGLPLRPLQRPISRLVHGTLGETRLHEPLTDLARWLRLKACLGAGTPLRTPEGSRLVEEVRKGDLVLSRPEDDPEGAVRAQVVEEVFVRTGRLWVLGVGGREVRITGEHPVWVARVGGWLPVSEVEAGDVLVGEDGERVEVEEVYDTGEYATVYNLRVAEYHTYFVGCQEWGFSVWAHNQCTYAEFEQALKEANPNFSPRMIKQMWNRNGGRAGSLDPDNLFYELLNPRTRTTATAQTARPRLTRAEAETVFRELGLTPPTVTNGAVGDLPHLVPTHGVAFSDSVAILQGKLRHGNKATHIAAAESEAHLAWNVHNMSDEVVIRWGAPVTSNGADVISVNLRTGRVSLWDAKHSIHPGQLHASKTFTHPDRLNYAVQQARRALGGDTTLPEPVRQQALRNLTSNKFNTVTVGFGRLTGQRV